MYTTRHNPILIRIQRNPIRSESRLKQLGRVRLKATASWPQPKSPASRLAPSSSSCLKTSPTPTRTCQDPACTGRWACTALGMGSFLPPRTSASDRRLPFDALTKALELGDSLLVLSALTTADGSGSSEAQAKKLVGRSHYC